MRNSDAGRRRARRDAATLRGHAGPTVRQSRYLLIRFAPLAIVTAVAGRRLLGRGPPTSSLANDHTESPAKYAIADAGAEHDQPLARPTRRARRALLAA